MARRRLSADEAALWRRVAGSVRPIRPLAVSTDQEAPPTLPHSAAPKAAPLAPPRVRRDTGKRASLAAKADTLDGAWDKRIGTGNVSPDRTIDLHGHSLAAAHHRLDRGLDDAIRDGARVILLITGRPARAGTHRMDLPLRGIIRESVGDWLAASRHALAIAAVRNAHPRHGGAGALYIVLRRAR